jgi:predicted deacylase
VVVSNFGDPRTATATACRAGLTTVGTEMGGGGTVRPEALAICRRGVRNVLAHLGILPAGASAVRRADAPLFELPGTRAFVYATADGIFEPYHLNGERCGLESCRPHPLHLDPTRAPELLHYEVDGILYG